VKIVVSTKDGRKISRSFSGCNVFKIYETENGKIVKKSSRLNMYNSRKRQKILNSGNQHIDEQAQVRNVIEGVKDCQVVICHRMNRRNWIKMGGSGVEMIFTTITDAENAVIKYLSGELKDEYHQIMDYS
jgi:predicted Fe-Mo cluster-binding NifX family protein